MEQLPAEIIHNICSTIDSKSYYNLALCGSKIYCLLPNWKADHRTKFNRCIEDINSMVYNCITENTCSRKFNNKIVLLAYRSRTRDPDIIRYCVSTVETIYAYYPISNEHIIYNLREIEIRAFHRKIVYSIKKNKDGERVYAREIASDYELIIYDNIL